MACGACSACKSHSTEGHSDLIFVGGVNIKGVCLDEFSQDNACLRGRTCNNLGESGEEPCDKGSIATKWAVICFVAQRKNNVSSRQRNPASPRPQQRNSQRELLKSVLRLVAQYEDSQRESGTALRSWLGLASLERFRGGCCAHGSSSCCVVARMWIRGTGTLV